MDEATIKKEPKNFPRDFIKDSYDGKHVAPYHFMTGIVKSMRLWQRVSGILMILLCLSVIMNFYIFLRNPLIPYLVTVTSDGNVLDQGEVHYTVTNPTDAQKSYFLRRSIALMREVPESYERFEEQKKELSYFTSKPVMTKLWNVDLRGRENLLRDGSRKFVEVKSITRLQNQPAYLVRWVETTVANNGTVISQRNYQGIASVSITPPEDVETLRVNPLGFYLEDFSTRIDEI